MSDPAIAMPNELNTHKIFTESDYSGPTEQVSLHSHSVYSSLDGVATPEQYAEFCATNGLPAMAITEHGHMASVPAMHLAFKKVGVKFIPGCEIYLNDYESGSNIEGVSSRRKFHKAGGKIKQLNVPGSDIYDPYLYERYARNRHLTVLAKNEQGFNNLLKLTTDAHNRAYGLGRVQFPRVGFEDLCRYKEGLIVLSGCLNGPIAHELRLKMIKRTEYEPAAGKGQRRRPKRDADGNIISTVVWDKSTQRSRLTLAIAWLKRFAAVFGEDFIIETQMPGLHDIYDEEVFRTSVALADQYKLKIALANDCHYLQRADFELQTVMMAVAQNTTVSDPDLFHVNSSEQYMKTRAELWAMFKNHGYSRGLDDRIFHEMCDNTLNIAERCQPLKIDSTTKMPDFDNADIQLQDLVMNELKTRGLYSSTKKYLIDGKPVTHKEQAELELDRLCSKGYASYFLITQDLINYSRSKGWPCGPRGSAAGSLVVHLLGISPIDPLPWGLSFDRFLSPSRGGYLLDVRIPNE